MPGITLTPGLRVLVTAGASGIGRAVADLLIDNGARVHVCDVADEHLADFRAAHPDHGASRCDVSREDEVAALFREVADRFGGLDALINNAGIAGPTGGVEEIAPADWRRTIDVCLTGQFLCTHFAVPMLKRSTDAAIVNMSSAAGRYGYAFRTPYSAAKWGVIGFTQSLAKELGPAGIRVNAILPGIIRGPRMEGVIRARAGQVGVPYDAMEQEYLNRISLRRMTGPEDVAATILFLLLPAGANISGQSLGVDGNVESLAAMKTAIIGSGFVGRAWTITFARAGHEVRLWDADAAALPAALRFIEGVLPDLAGNDLLRGSAPADVMARLRPIGDLATALDGVDHVQENTPERVEVKQQVFADLDRHAPAGAVLASSTSALLPSTFTADLAGRARCLVCHPINPPYLVPAVEVCPAPWTSPEAVEKAAAFMRSCGQAPLVMKREIDGFIMNRLQGALLEEAFRLVADGVAGVEDVDVGLRDGLALRWSFMGPFETIDLNAPGGVRDYAERYQGIYSNIFPSVQRRVDWSGPVMDGIERDRTAKLGRDKLGERQVWRDRRLMALLAHKRQAANDIGD